MKARILAVSIATLLILGAGPALADTVLYTPVLDAPVGGTLRCHATNVGKKPLAQIDVALYYSGGESAHTCSDVPTVSSAGISATCSQDLADMALCVITISGGNHRSVRAVLNVVDANGGTILSVPAAK